jgi:outer membrane protein OmpA-like peptidoglycan-associated protein
MKNSALKLSALLVSFCFSGCTTNYLYEKASIEFDNLQYASAIQDYNKVLAKKNMTCAKIRLADSYRLVNDFEAAAPLYADVVNLPESEPVNMLHYARVLMTLKEYDHATTWLNKYMDARPDDAIAAMLLKSCQQANLFMHDTASFTLRELTNPGFASAFGQVPYRDGIVFAADKMEVSNSKKEPWTGKSFYDLYYRERDANGNWMDPQPIAGDINGRYHEGPAVFNKEGDVAYFTRSNYLKNKLLKSSKNENNLKLFSARLIDDEWKQLQELPFNSDEYSVGHPALSADEATLYFISDMPGGFGGTDIYKSDFDGKTWGKPENLGAVINTPGNEKFPFFSAEGKLYFSSDAHINMGGLDIFSSGYDKENNKWLPVETMSYPMNSSYDDFAYVQKENAKTGYITSNRNSPDAIYEFKMKDPEFNLIGRVISKVSKMPLGNAAITVRDKTNNTEASVQTDANGRYEFRLKPSAEFGVEASKENYLATSAKNISTKNKLYSEEFVRDFELDSLLFNLIGKVIEKESKMPIENALITLTNQADNSKVTVLTDKKGLYEMKLKPGVDFVVAASKEKFLTQSADVSTKNRKVSEEFVRNFVLDSLILNKPIVVENIYYDFDKWFIRPDAALELNKLVRTLNDNPTINIQMGSHADSRGSDQYNLVLTDKRAKAAVEYLVSQGIDKERLTWKGYGESRLVNKCKNNVFCTDEEHQKNRRTEFKVTRINIMSKAN